MAETEKNTVKFFHGPKANIDAQLAAGDMDGADIVITSDTDEIVYIDKTKAKKPIKSRTEKSYTLTGTDLGGLTDGSTISSSLDLDDFLELITKKAKPVEYVKPKVTASVTDGSIPGNYEVGTEINSTVLGVYVQNDGGNLAAIRVLKDGQPVLESATGPLSTPLDPITLADGKVSITVSADYAEGPVKVNNLGEEDATGRIPAGTLTSEPIEFIGYRCAFYGAGMGAIPALGSDSIRSLTKKLNPEEETVLTIPVAVGQKYVIFAYPATLRDVSKVEYVELGDASMASSFTQQIVPVEGANNSAAVDYKVYTYEMASPVEVPITFEVTI